MGTILIQPLMFEVLVFLHIGGPGIQGRRLDCRLSAHFLSLVVVVQKGPRDHGKPWAICK